MSTGPTSLPCDRPGCSEPAAALVARIYADGYEPATGWHPRCLDHAARFAGDQAASTKLPTETRIRPLAWGIPTPAGH